MTVKEKRISIQDNFLEEIKKSKKTIEIFLINGLILKCKIINSDNFSLLIDLKNKKALIYKHSIAYIK
jgi:host factor-I protein